MKTCVFCNQEAGSKEHIIAQWLIEAMQAQDKKITVAYVDEKGLHKRQPHTLNSYVTRHVCTKCNTGWMSVLENICKENLGPLVLPEWPLLAKDYITLALKQKEKLTQWALKTAVMMNENSVLDSIADVELRESLYKGEVARGVVLELAYIERADINKEMSRGFPVQNGGEPTEWLARHDGKAFCCAFQLQHLGVRIFRCIGAEPYYTTTHNRLPMRMYPYSANPETLDFRFHDFTEFAKCLYLRSHIGMEWEIRP